MVAKQIKVAVAILTYNRRNFLERTLDSLLYSAGEYDLFVFDNGSTDGSQQLLASLNEAGVFSEVKFNETGIHTAGFGMNRAIEMAMTTKPDLILLSADDYCYNLNWFNSFIEFWTAANNKIKLVGLNIEPLYPWNEIIDKIECGGQRALLRTSIGGSQWSFMDDDLDLIYPLREITGGEDLEVCRRLINNGHKIAALNLSEHIGERDSVWGNRSWEYARQLPSDILDWIGEL